MVINPEAWAQTQRYWKNRTVIRNALVRASMFDEPVFVFGPGRKYLRVEPDGSITECEQRED